MNEENDLTESLKQDIESSAKSSAKDQIIVNREEIEKAIKEGFSKKRIWRKLNESGKFNFLYPAFMKAYTKLTNSNPTPVRSVQVSPQVAIEKTEDDQRTIEDKKHEIPAPKKKFSHNPNSDNSDLI